MAAMRTIFLAVLVALAAFVQPATAGKTKQVRYVGVHPVPASPPASVTSDAGARDPLLSGWAKFTVTPGTPLPN